MDSQSLSSSESIDLSSESLIPQPEEDEPANPPRTRKERTTVSQQIVHSVIVQVSRPNPPNDSEIAENVGLSASALYRLMCRIYNGDMESGENNVFIPTKKGRPSLQTPATMARVKELLTQRPTATLESTKEALENEGIFVSVATIWRIAQSAGLSHQKIVPRTAVVFTPRNVQQRFDYSQRVDVIPDAELWFLDESGFNLHLAPQRCWSDLGQTPVQAVPANRGRNRSLLMCISSSGIMLHDVKDGGYKAADFVVFIQALSHLFPQVQTRQVCLVMDNAPIHRAAEDTDNILDNNVRHLFLPPYSPDLNPIENVFGVLKKRYRRLGVVQNRREMETRIQAVIEETNRDLDFRRFYQRTRTFVQRGINREPFN